MMPSVQSSPEGSSQHANGTARIEPEGAAGAKAAERLRRIVLGLLVLGGLAGCAATDSFDQSVSRIGQSIEAVRNGSILTNIVRASYGAPLSFVSVPTVHGSTMVGGTAGLPTLTFGPGQTALQGQYAFGPNSLTASGTTSFDLVTLDTKDFDRGLLTTLSLESLEFFAKQGFPRDVLFFLTFDRIVVGRGASRRELRNDPRYPSFREFYDKMAIALDLGLTIESTSGDKKVVRFCFDPSLASRTIDGARPLCGSDQKAGFSLGRIGGPEPSQDLEVELRSTQGIFYALGHMVNAPPDEQITIPDRLNRPSGEPLFEVQKGISVSPCLAQANYAAITYCVPLGRARNSALAIGLLAQLLALNTSINDLPLTSTIRITP